MPNGFNLRAKKSSLPKKVVIHLTVALRKREAGIIWKKSGTICENIQAQSKAIMMPNGIDLKAKNASRGAMGRYRLEVWKLVNFEEKYWFCMIHSSNVWKSVNFAAYIRKLWFWSLRIRHPYQGSEMEWPFCRENLKVRSRILDMGASLRINGFS